MHHGASATPTLCNLQCDLLISPHIALSQAFASFGPTRVHTVRGPKRAALREVSSKRSARNDSIAPRLRAGFAVFWFDLVGVVSYAILVLLSPLVARIAKGIGSRCRCWTTWATQRRAWSAWHSGAKVKIRKGRVSSCHGCLVSSHARFRWILCGCGGVLPCGSDFGHLATCFLLCTAGGPNIGCGSSHSMSHDAVRSP